VLVGRPDWVLSQLPTSSQAAASQLQQAAAADAAAGKSTQVYVAVGDQLLGGLGFRDTLRQDALETVAALKAMGLRVYLLSGDDTATVKAVAAQAGIAAGDAFGSNTPKQKLDVIRELQVRCAVIGYVDMD
jgi:P-type E1-E2 ATPase